MIDTSLLGAGNMLQNMVDRNNQISDRYSAAAGREINRYMDDLYIKNKQAPVNEAIQQNVDENGNLKQSEFLKQIAENSPENYLGLNSALKSQESELNKSNAAVNVSKADAFKKQYEAYSAQSENIKKQIDASQTLIKNVTNELVNVTSDTEKLQIINKYEKQYGFEFPSILKNTPVSSPEYKNIVSTTGNGYLEQAKSVREEIDLTNKTINDKYNADTNRMNAETNQQNAKTNESKVALDILKQEDTTSKDITDRLVSSSKDIADLQKNVNEFNKELMKYKEDQLDAFGQIDGLNKAMENIKKAAEPFAGNRNEMLKNVFSNLKDEKYVNLANAIEQFRSLAFVQNARQMSGLGALSDAEGKKLENIYSQITNENSTLRLILEGVESVQVNKRESKKLIEEKYLAKEAMVKEGIANAEARMGNINSATKAYTNVDLLNGNLPTSLPGGNQGNLPPLPPNAGAGSMLNGR